MKKVATLTNHPHPYEVYVKVWEKGGRKRYYINVRRGIQKNPAEVGYFENCQFYCTSKKFEHLTEEIIALYDIISQVQPDKPKYQNYFDPENPRNFKELVMSEFMRR